MNREKKLIEEKQTISKLGDKSTKIQKGQRRGRKLKYEID